MSELIQTIEGWDYSLVDKRCLTHEGCIVDLGCLDWDWSKFFIDKKRIIGADPYETQIPGVELFKGIVLDYNGKINFSNKGIGSSIFDGGNDSIDTITWKKLCEDFNIDKISVLKMNIEGSEYRLIKSMTSEDFDKIDQIAVSFHDWLNPSWLNETNDCIEILKNNNFSIRQIYPTFGWYLATKNY
jgi:hypothetical protein